LSVVNPTWLRPHFLFAFVYQKYLFNRYLSLLLGVAVWLADCWKNRKIHAREGLVTIGRPCLLRLDRRHNQAESDQQVICIYCKAGAFCDD
jgi:hypothetical protein